MQKKNRRRRKRMIFEINATVKLEFIRKLRHLIYGTYSKFILYSFAPNETIKEFFIRAFQTFVIEVNTFSNTALGWALLPTPAWMWRLRAQTPATNLWQRVENWTNTCRNAKLTHLPVKLGFKSMRLLKIYLRKHCSGSFCAAGLHNETCDKKKSS